jgi:DNA-binding NarL/FixJ family response regulator
VLARGYSSAQIADKLGTRRATVRSHIHHLLAKLGMHDRVQAVALAYETGLIRPT